MSGVNEVCSVHSVSSVVSLLFPGNHGKHGIRRMELWKAITNFGDQALKDELNAGRDSPPHVVRRKIFTPGVAFVDHEKGNATVEGNARVDRASEPIVVTRRRGDRDRDLVFGDARDDRDAPVLLRSDKQTSAKRNARESYLSLGRFHDFR